MKKRILLVLIVLPLAVTFSFAQEFQFEGFYEYYGGIEPSGDYEDLRSRLYMNPSFSGFFDSSGLEWVVSGKIWVQTIGEPESIDPWDILDETYLLLPGGNFDLILGQKLVTYGFADIYGPLNVLHSAHKCVYSLDSKYESRRPDPLFQIKYYPTYSDSIELTYIPLTRPDVEQPEEVYLPETMDTIVWSDEPFLTENPHSIFLNYSRYGEKMDFQLFYGWYTENTPDFKIETIDSLQATEIEPVYNKKHTIGAAWASRVLDGTLSQDLAFNFTSDWDGSDPGAQNSDIIINTQYLVNLPWGILSQTTLVYSYIINHGEHDDTPDSAASDYLAETFQGFHTQPQAHIAFAVGHFEKSFIREKLKTQLNIGFFFSPELYIAPRLAYSLTDYWTIETGADINLGEPPDQDLRRNTSDDNFYLRIIYRY